MIKTSIELMAETIGFDIGQSDNITQSNLLNGLGRSLNNSNTNNREMQLCYINDKLSKDAKQLIVDLSLFIKES